ncbi:hypothetical protein PSHT_07096 [Puccinia striiformis]|uniref:Uncharacterized protein n=1 Tax=Puccinia striiformis TaxID=27350 RepID=A0A2S4W0W4_9BASI|nr:hypothetical protein PSHT_07096 [Puccinia striiformis]
MEGISGVKPIPPPILTTKSTSKNTEGWLSFVTNGFTLYKKGENQ